MPTMRTLRRLRRFPAVAVLDNKIYVTGGLGDDDQPLSRVDCYDPDTNSWSKVASMNVVRRGHSLVSLDGRLYALGGLDSSIGYIDSVEVYDPDNNTWTLLQHKLDGKVVNTGAGLIMKGILTNVNNSNQCVNE